MVFCTRASSSVTEWRCERAKTTKPSSYAQMVAVAAAVAQRKPQDKMTITTSKISLVLFFVLGGSDAGALLTCIQSKYRNCVFCAISVLAIFIHLYCTHKHILIKKNNIPYIFSTVRTRSLMYVFFVHFRYLYSAPSTMSSSSSSTFFSFDFSILLLFSLFAFILLLPFCWQ